MDNHGKNMCYNICGCEKMNELEIVSLDHQGRGIGKLEGKTIFVENALPNEIINVDIITSKKNFCEAIVNKYIQKSTERIEPLCPYFALFIF